LAEITENCLDVQVNDFIGAQDLADGINLKIQAMSMVPKSEVSKNQTYLDLGKQGLMPPQMSEPSPAGDKLRDQLFERLGLETFDSDQGIELQKAKWENNLMLQGNPAAVSEYDQSIIHLPCHIAQIQDPNFLEKATPEIYDLFQAHIQEHKQADLKAQQEQMNQEANMQLEAQKQALMGAASGMPQGGTPMPPPMPEQGPPVDAPMQ